MSTYSPTLINNFVSSPSPLSSILVVPTSSKYLEGHSNILQACGVGSTTSAPGRVEEESKQEASLSNLKPRVFENFVSKLKMLSDVEANRIQACVESFFVPEAVSLPCICLYWGPLICNRQIRELVYSRSHMITFANRKVELCKNTRQIVFGKFKKECEGDIESFREETKIMLNDAYGKILKKFCCLKVLDSPEERRISVYITRSKLQLWEDTKSENLRRMDNEEYWSSYNEIENVFVNHLDQFMRISNVYERNSRHLWRNGELALGSALLAIVGLGVYIVAHSSL